MPLNLSAWTPTLWARETLRFLRNYLVIGRLVNRDYQSQLSQFGHTVNIPLPPSLAAQMKTKGVPVTFTEVGASSIPVVLDKHIVTAFQVDDVEAAQTNVSVMANYGTASAIAIATEIEGYLLKRYVDAASAVGTPGTVFAKGNLLKARTRLNTARTPLLEPRVAILSSKDMEGILDNLSNSNAGAMFGERAELREGAVGRLYGFDLFESNMAPEVPGTPLVTHGMAFHRDALTMVNRRLPDPPDGTGVRTATVQDEGTGLAIRVMMSYDHAHFTQKVTYDLLIGAKTIRPEFMVDLQS